MGDVNRVAALYYGNSEGGINRSPEVSTMHDEIPVTRTILKDENAIRWEFLEDQGDACAVVSERMELLYLNAAGRALTLPDWFAKRCFEVLPNRDENCAWHCPTITAVSGAEEITYCEEALAPADGTSVILGTAVIPMEHSTEDGAKALLLFRPKATDSNQKKFEEKLLADARHLHAIVAAHHH